MANFIFLIFYTDMKVSNIFQINTKDNNSTTLKQKNSATEICKNTSDSFCKKVDYILCSKSRRFGELDIVVFKTSISPAKGLLSLLYSTDKNITNALLYKMHTPDELVWMALDVASDDYLSTLKVTKLVGLGSKAFVFELNDGKILKLTNGSHFPNRRKPDFFDVPIIKQGRSCRTYYYIEEKMNQKGLSQEKLQNFIKMVEEKGYTFRDHFHSNEKDKINPKIRTEQFGISKNGQLYLLDPECALAPKKQLAAIKFIKDKFTKIFKVFSLLK